MGNIIILFLGTVLYFLKLYFLLLVVRVLLYWFPSVSFFDEPFYSISKLTDPYISLFNSLLPSILGMDLSPLLGFLILQVLIDAVPRAISKIGSMF